MYVFLSEGSKEKRGTKIFVKLHWILFVQLKITTVAQSPTGYRKRTAQILRATDFYDLLM